MNTMREFMNAIVNGESITEEMKNFATKEIEKIDKKNERRRNTPSKTQLENLEIANQIYEKMNPDEILTCAEIVEKFEIQSSSKATALMKILVDNEKVEVVEVKVKGKGKVNGYKKKVA